MVWNEGQSITHCFLIIFKGIRPGIFRAKGKILRRHGVLEVGLSPGVEDLREPKKK